MNNSPINWRDYSIDDLKASNPSAIAIGPFGSRMKSDVYVSSGIPVIRGNNISDTRSFSNDFVYVSQATADSLASANVFDGDLVFPHRGAIGAVGLVSGKDAHYILSTSLMKLTCNREIADPQYLFYFFRSPTGRHELLKNASTVGTPGIATPLTSLRAIRVKLPPLPEQRAIAHILGTLDDKIEVNRRMNETLEGIARAIFRSWFVDFDPVRAKAAGRESEGLDAGTAALFPDAFDELDSLPAGWETRAIGDVVTVVGGSTPSTTNSAYWGGENAFATPRDMSALASPILLATDRRITEEGLSQISSGLLPSGTVIMSSRAPIGYLAIAAIPVTVNQGIIAMICDKELPNYYVLLWAQQNMDTIVGHANGTTFPEISKRNFRPLSVVVPPAPILRRYSEIVGPLYEKITANLREDESLTSLRDSLLPRLLSGELRVGDVAVEMEQ